MRKITSVAIVKCIAMLTISSSVFGQQSQGDSSIPVGTLSPKAEVLGADLPSLDSSYTVEGLCGAFARFNNERDERKAKLSDVQCRKWSEQYLIDLAAHRSKQIETSQTIEEHCARMPFSPEIGASVEKLDQTRDRQVRKCKQNVSKHFEVTNNTQRGEVIEPDPAPSERETVCKSKLGQSIGREKLERCTQWFANRAEVRTGKKPPIELPVFDAIAVTKQ
jgi:hypothetical protein